jgi:hypothetical protein
LASLRYLPALSMGLAQGGGRQPECGAGTITAADSPGLNAAPINTSKSNDKAWQCATGDAMLRQSYNSVPSKIALRMCPRLLGPLTLETGDPVHHFRFGV